LLRIGEEEEGREEGQRRSRRDDDEEKSNQSAKVFFSLSLSVSRCLASAMNGCAEEQGKRRAKVFIIIINQQFNEGGTV
jgi:hypothetical protein